MKLNIDNASISRLFSLVQNIAEVKAAISAQETVMVSIDEELAEFRDEGNGIVEQIRSRAKLLREGSMEGLQELLHLQWLQEEAAKKVEAAEVRMAGIRTSLSLLDDELIALQKQVDAVLQGHKA